MDDFVKERAFLEEFPQDEDTRRSLAELQGWPVNNLDLVEPGDCIFLSICFLTIQSRHRARSSPALRGGIHQT